MSSEKRTSKIQSCNSNGIRTHSRTARTGTDLGFSLYDLNCFHFYSFESVYPTHLLRQKKTYVSYSLCHYFINFAYTNFARQNYEEQVPRPHPTNFSLSAGRIQRD